MRRLLCTLLAAALVALALARPAVAQDSGDDERLRERIELVRNLPEEEQLRLREALRRFQSLPAEKQAELRRRAGEVGPDRLRELVGRDVERLRRRHDALERERRAILAALGGAERFSGLSDVELRFLRSEAVRRFQKHVRRAVLGIAGPAAMEEFNRRTPRERRELLRTRLRELEAELIADESPEAQRAYHAASPREQRDTRRRLLAEYRLRLVPSFVAELERQVVLPFLRLDAEERRATTERWVRRARWFEMRRRLDRDVGVSREELRLLAEMGPEQWARVRDIYVRSEGQDASERRLEIERAIRELHGQLATDGDIQRRGHQGRLRRLLREERRRRRGDARAGGERRR